MEKMNIKIPFTEEELDKYFDTIEDYYFIISLKNSEYKDNKILNYIYNTGMTCDIDLSECEYEDIEKILLSYIKTNKIISIPSLNILWLKIILSYALNEKTNDLFISHFIKNNEEIILNLIEILYCLKIFLLNIIFEKTINAENKDIKDIGNNFISLRDDPEFWEVISIIDNLELKYYFYNQFEIPCFDGYKIAHYFYDEFTPFCIIKLCSEIIEK